MVSCSAHLQRWILHCSHVGYVYASDRTSNAVALSLDLPPVPVFPVFLVIGNSSCRVNGTNLSLRLSASEGIKGKGSFRQFCVLVWVEVEPEPEAPDDGDILLRLDGPEDWSCERKYWVSCRSGLLSEDLGGVSCSTAVGIIEVSSSRASSLPGCNLSTILRSGIVRKKNKEN